MTRAVHAVAGGRKRLTLFGVVVIALIAGFAAFAYFTSSGSGNGSASTGTLNPPTAVSGLATSTTVAVSWTNSAGPLVPTGYYVTRSNGGPTVAACGSAPGGPYVTSPCNDLTVPNGSWTYTVTAVYRSWTASASSSAVPVAATATHLAFNVQPSNTVAGLAISPSVTVRVLDASNNVVTGDNSTKVTLAIGASPGGGTLSGTLQQTAASGIATFSGISIDKTGTGYTLTATDTTGGGGIHPLTGSTSSAFNITPGVANHIDLAGSATDVASGSTRGLTATIKDANGNTVTTDSTTVVTFAKTAGTGTVSGLGTATAASGVASKTVTGVLAGSITLAATATSPSLPAGTTLTFNVVAGAANHIDLSGSVADLASGSTRGLTATIKDAAGNTVLSDSSTAVTFAKTSGVGTVSGLGTATAASGVASKTVTGLLAGSITLAATATSPSLPAGTTLTFDVVAGAASQVALTGSITDLVSGSARTFTATVQDAAGNTVAAGADSSVSVAFAQTAGVGTVTGAGSSAASGGVATRNLTGVLAGSVTVRASATLSVPGAVNSNTLTFNIVAGAASKLAFTQSPSNTSADNALSPQPQVTVQDAAGNTVTADTSNVTLSIKSGTPSSGGPGSITSCGANPTAASGGVATFAGCKITTVGTAYQVHAVDGILAAADSGAFNITPGTANATQSTLTPTSASITANGSATQVLTVTAKDASGNNLTAGGSTVAITRQSGTGTIGSVTDNGNGTYTATVTAPVATGTGVFVATLGGNPVRSGTGSQTLATITYIPGAADANQSTLTPTSASITANGSATQVLTVTAKDVTGNNLTVGGLTVAITRQSGTGTVGSVVDNGDGTYTATVTAPSAVGSGVFVATLSGQPVKSGTGAQTQSTLTYVPGAADATQSTLAPSSASITADGSSTQVLTVTAKDATGNNLTVGGSTVTIIRQSGTGTIGSVTDNGNGTYTAAVTAPVATGSGVFVATLGGNPVRSGTGSQTQATITYVSGTATSGGSGSWCLGSTWSTGVVPTSTTDVVIGSGDIVTVPTTGCTPVAKTVTLDSGGDAALTFTSTATLTVTGDVTVSGNANGNSQDLNVNAGTLTVGGNLSVTSSNGNRKAAMRVTTGTVNVAGNLSVTGGSNTTFSASSGSTFALNGTAPQTVTNTVAGFDNLTINNAGSSVTLGSAITINGNLLIQSGTFSNGGFIITGLASGKSLSVSNGATYKLTGTTSIVSVTGGGTKTFGATSTVEYAGAAQTISAETYGNLTFSAAGTKTAAAGTTTVAGNLTNNAGTFVPGSSTYSFTGAGTTIGGSQATTFNNLTIGAAVSLSGVDANVGATLALGTNVLSTGSNKVNVTSTTAPTRSTGYVNGALQRTGSVSTMVFNVGNGSLDTTVNVGVTACTTCTVTVRSTAGEHPNIATSGISSTKDVNTYWTLASTGTITFGPVTFTYPSGNVDGSATPASFLVKRWNGVAWSAVTVSGTPTNTSTSVTGLTSAALGDFVIGNP